MTISTTKTGRGMWSVDEHDRFLRAQRMYPQGPWKAIAEYVGTRTARQVQTHAQKYYEKVARRLRGLQKTRKKLVRQEHRLDEEMTKLCRVADTNEELNRFQEVSHPMIWRRRTIHDAITTTNSSFPLAAFNSCSRIDDDTVSEAGSRTESEATDCSIDTIDLEDSCLDYLLQMLDSNDSENNINCHNRSSDDCFFSLTL